MRKNNQGFIVLELMIVVAILGITTAIAAPSFTEMIKNNRISSYVNDFVAALQFAKAEAVTLVIRRLVMNQAAPGINQVGG